MDYAQIVKRLLLRYPHKAEKVRIFISPDFSGLEPGCLSSINSYFEEVDNPNDADYIPVWVDYKHRCTDALLDFVEKYPDKCLSSFNFLESLNVEMPELDDQAIEDVKDLLESPDWEAVFLGLNILRNSFLTDRTKNIAKCVIDTVRSDCNNNTGSVIPYGKTEQDRIEIGNLEIVKFFQLWLHNELLVI